MSDFGDIEADDAFDADDTIAPEQVGRRLHELRAFIDRLAGGAPRPYHELSAADRARLDQLGAVIAADYSAQPGQSAVLLAERIHDARRAQDRSLPAWAILPDSHQALAAAIAAALIAWLQREGHG